MESCRERKMFFILNLTIAKKQALPVTITRKRIKYNLNKSIIILGSETSSLRSGGSDNRKSVHEIKAGFEFKPETSKQKDYVAPKMPVDSPRMSKNRQSFLPSAEFQERAIVVNSVLDNLIKPSSSTASDLNRQSTKQQQVIPPIENGLASKTKSRDLVDNSQTTELVPKKYFGGFIDEKIKAEMSQNENKKEVRRSDGFMPVGSFLPNQNGIVVGGVNGVKKNPPPPEPPIDYDLNSPKKQITSSLSNGILSNGAVNGTPDDKSSENIIYRPENKSNGSINEPIIAVKPSKVDNSLSKSSDSLSNGDVKPLLERRNHARRTVTRKTRVYVVDGVQVTSTTYHVMAEDGSRNYKVKEDFNLRLNKMFFIGFYSFTLKFGFIKEKRNYKRYVGCKKKKRVSFRIYP